MIGGRNALENRRFLKHLTSGQYSSGFHGDLNTARSKLISGNKQLVDRSKEKRIVVKRLTKATRTSMMESVLLEKVGW